MSIKHSGTVAKKRFGQHFLSDQHVIDRIIQVIDPKPEQTVIEIGPGTGILTEALLARIPSLYAVEIDRDLAKMLEVNFQAQHLTLFLQDALSFDFEQLADKKPLRVVGNLPYNISTPFIFHCLKHAPLIQDMHFMLQKEVVDRLAAPPGSKTYGRLSVMAQYSCQISSLFNVGPGSFSPPPKVDSAVVRLIPRSFEPTCRDPELLARIVLRAFQQRRKTIHNSLKGMVTDEELLQVQIPPQERAENISVQKFVMLANIIHEKGCLSL